MIPHHILNDLRPAERVAILARSQELLFIVHQASDSADAIRAHAALDGYEVLATHLQDEAEIKEFARARERDVGGEG